MAVQPEHLFLPIFDAVVLIILTAVLIAVNWWAANGRLQRNRWVGIRMPSTMRSDQSWLAGHRAALRLAPLHLLTLAATLIVLFLAAQHARTVNGIQLAWLGDMFVFVLVILYTAFVAGRAAKAAENNSDDRES